MASFEVSDAGLRVEMSDEQPKNPLHGITLKMIVEDLVARHGWEGLAWRIKIGCFTNNPSVSSSLKLLRRTPWARRKVERLYLADQKKVQRNKARASARLARAQAEAVPVDAAPVDVTPVDVTLDKPTDL